MLRDDDEFDEPHYECPICGRTFHTYSRLDAHMAEHEGLPHCNKCGQNYRGLYHRC